MLQDFISSQQTTFLPGRLLHHSMLLTGEVVHVIMKGLTLYILAKLDIMKAFDLLDWAFLFEIINTFGFGPYFTLFLKAIMSSTSSKIHLNVDKSMKAIKIRCSVRQGCPLSPLLFIIAMGSLYQMVDRAEANDHIIGFRWEALNIRYTISMYDNDVMLLLKVELPNILACTMLFEVFGEASNLKWQ